MKIPYEKILYSNLNLPINSVYMNSTQGKISSDAHMHEEIELVYLSAGSMIFSFINETVEVNEGELIFVNTMVPHNTFVDETKFTEICALQFHPKLLMSTQNDNLTALPFTVNNNDTPFHTVKLKDNNDLNSVSNCLYNINREITHKDTAYELSIITNIYQIFVALFRYGGLNLPMIETLNSPNDTVEKIRLVFDCIEEHYSEEITLDYIANLVNYSNQYFCSIFKKATGKSFVEYLNNFRIKKAELLLINTNDTINNIYIKTGFSSFSYFNRVFKKYSGYSPSEYRTVLRNKYRTDNTPKTK